MKLTESLSTELKRVLEERGLSASSAARALGVSRQAFHAYLSGKAMPRPKTLGRAMEMWDFEIRGGGKSFNSEAFLPAIADAPQPVQQQLKLDLWQKLDGITEDNLKIGVKRVGKTLRLAVRIEIPA